MQKDMEKMIDYIKELSSLIYGKEVFFYEEDSNTWYSRDHCRYIELEELIDWLRENINLYLVDKIN